MKRETIPLLDSTSYAVDQSLSLILYNGDDILYDSLVIFKQDTFSIVTKDSQLMLGKPYEISNKNASYTLYRTETPLVVINTDSLEVPDEPKTAGVLSLKEKNETRFTSYMGIERRGKYSQTFPKKSYSMELWEDKSGEEERKESLLGMRDDGDWILDGLWNEPLRIRDFTAHELWLQMGRYHFKEEEPETTAGIDRKYCEVFLNGSYRGIYYLGEKIDRKQLNLKKYDGSLRGSLYKTNTKGKGVLFEELEDFSNDSKLWSGYEVEYPDKIGELDWTKLHAFVDFVINSDQQTFDGDIENRIDMENFIDYFLFLNTTFSSDNLRKNMFIGKYDTNTPYFLVPWDMDASFGNGWQGSRIQDTDYVLSNVIFDRLLLNANFVIGLKSRWNKLKNSTLGAENIKQLLMKNYRYLKDNGSYAREDLGDELSFRHADAEIDFMTSWVDVRVMFMDNYISNL